MNKYVFELDLENIYRDIDIDEGKKVVEDVQDQTPELDTKISRLFNQFGPLPIGLPDPIEVWLRTFFFLPQTNHTAVPTLFYQDRPQLCFPNSVNASMNAFSSSNVTNWQQPIILTASTANTPMHNTPAQYSLIIPAQPSTPTPSSPVNLYNHTLPKYELFNSDIHQQPIQTVGSSTNFPTWNLQNLFLIPNNHQSNQSITSSKSPTIFSNACDQNLKLAIPYKELHQQLFTSSGGISSITNDKYPVDVTVASSREHQQPITSPSSHGCSREDSSILGREHQEPTEKPEDSSVADSNKLVQQSVSCSSSEKLIEGSKIFSRFTDSCQPIQYPNASSGQHQQERIESAFNISVRNDLKQHTTSTDVETQQATGSPSRLDDLYQPMQSPNTSSGKKQQGSTENLKDLGQHSTSTVIQTQQASGNTSSKFGSDTDKGSIEIGTLTNELVTEGNGSTSNVTDRVRRSRKRKNPFKVIISSDDTPSSNDTEQLTTLNSNQNLQATEEGTLDLSSPPPENLMDHSLHNPGYSTSQKPLFGISNSPMDLSSPPPENLMDHSMHYPGPSMAQTPHNGMSNNLSSPPLENLMDHSLHYPGPSMAQTPHNGMSNSSQRQDHNNNLFKKPNSQKYFAEVAKNRSKKGGEIKHAKDYHGCGLCGFVCTSESDIKLHMLSYHSKGPSNKGSYLPCKTSEIWMCNYCAYRHPNMEYVQTHIKLMHKSYTVNNCPMCDFRCIKPEDLKDHLRMKHNLL